MFEKIFKKKIKLVHYRFTKDNIIRESFKSNFLGQESLGSKQVRGNGILILTKSKIYFQLYVPKKEIAIPISKITKIEITKSFLKKKKYSQLLKITITKEDGSLDAIAWQLNDLNGWKSDLEKMIGN